MTEEWYYDIETAKNQEGKFLITYDHRIHPSADNPVDVEMVFYSRKDDYLKWLTGEVADVSKIIAWRELPALAQRKSGR